jgi:hypothetical protein
MSSSYISSPPKLLHSVWWDSFFYLLPDGLTAQWCYDILETVLPGLLEDVSTAVRQKLWSQNDVAPAHYRGKCEAVFERDISRKVDWTWRTYCMASSVAGSNSGRFLSCRDIWRSTFTQFLAGVSRSRGKISSRCDNGRCQHVMACLTECRAAHYPLPWNGRRPLGTPAVITRHQRLDLVIACAIWRWWLFWKLNVIGHMLYNIFYIFFNKEWHYGELCASFVSLCILIRRDCRYCR